MDRRKVLAVAGAVSLTAAAAAAAVGANFGLFGLTGPADRVGELSPVSAADLEVERVASSPVSSTPDVQTIYLDDVTSSALERAGASEAVAEPEEHASTDPAGSPAPVADAPEPSSSSLTTTTSTEVHDDHAEEPEPTHEHEPDD